MHKTVMYTVAAHVMKIFSDVPIGHFQEYLIEKIYFLENSIVIIIAHNS